jgi:hypothetical protein
MLLSLLNYKYLDVMGGLMLTYQAKLCRERHARLIKVVVLISHGSSLRSSFQSQ